MSRIIDARVHLAKTETRHPIRGSRALAIACWLASFATRSDAITVLQQDLRTVAVRADAVILGHCIAVRPGVDSTTHQLSTTSEFAINEVVKGALRNHSVELTLPGGADGQRAATIAGVPSFTVGEDAVLFLTAPRGDGSRGVIGLGQGVFAVIHGVNGPEVRMSAVPGLNVGRVASGENGAATTTVPVEAFLDQVRSYLR